MHNCEKCNKKVKNGFKMCYACNDLKSDSKSDSESEIVITPSFKPYIKDSIPRAVKNCLWINYFNTSRVGVCTCCLREPITINNFHAGHKKSEREGGSTTLDNLAPICPLCNSSMGTMHMEEFISKYNLHYGLQKNN
jgi:hypothetical protein